MKPTKSLNMTAAFCASVLLALNAFGQTITLTNGLVGYWPMDNVVGCNNQTPDVVNGYNLQVCYGGGNSSGLFLTNFNSLMYLTNDAVRGNSVFYRGSAFAAGGSGGNGQNMYLAFKSANTNDLVPVNRYSPGSNTISFWIKGIEPAANWPIPNNDQRVWCESDYIRTYASVFDLSPTSSGYDIFVRQSGTAPYGNFSGGVHTTCTGTIIDGTWHNVTIETQNAGAGTNTANWVVYIDSVLDPSTVGAANLAKPGGLWKLDTLALFALVRNGSAGFVTNDVSVDDLAEWSRNLSTNEIFNFMTNGIPGAGGGVAPVSINQFSADRYVVDAGSPVQLSWQASSDATDIAIDNGVGDVTFLSSCGVGSTNVIVNGNTTFHLIAKRGSQSVTNALLIQTVTGQGPDWNYVGGFNENALGPLLDQGNWQTLLSSPQTQGYTEAQVLDTITGNHVLAIAGATELSAGFFGNEGIAINDTNTLFFRFYVDGNIDTNDATLGGIPDVDINVGASDAALRDLVDFTGTPPTTDGNANALGVGPGPAVRIFRSQGGVGGPIDLTANYVDNTGTYQYYSYIASVDPNGLATNTVYNVWIDVYNNQNNPNLANGVGGANYYQVTIQKGGDTGTVIPLFSWVISDRTTNSFETLNEAFICANSTAGQSTNMFVRFDDFYLSASNVNHTIPIPQGSFVLGVPTSPASISVASVGKSGTSVTLNWTPVPAGSFTYTVLTASSVNGPWSTLTTGYSGTSYTDTSATANQKFYRITSP